MLMKRIVLILVLLLFFATVGVAEAPEGILSEIRKNTIKKHIPKGGIQN